MGSCCSSKRSSAEGSVSPTCNRPPNEQSMSPGERDTGATGSDSHRASFGSGGFSTQEPSPQNPLQSGQGDGLSPASVGSDSEHIAVPQAAILPAAVAETASLATPPPSPSHRQGEINSRGSPSPQSTEPSPTSSSLISLVTATSSVGGTLSSVMNVSTDEQVVAVPVPQLLERFRKRRDHYRRLAAEKDSPPPHRLSSEGQLQNGRTDAGAHNTRENSNNPLASSPQRAPCGQLEEEKEVRAAVATEPQLGNKEGETLTPRAEELRDLRANEEVHHPHTSALSKNVSRVHVIERQRKMNGIPSRKNSHIARSGELQESLEEIEEEIEFRCASPSGKDANEPTETLFWLAIVDHELENLSAKERKIREFAEEKKMAARHYEVMRNNRISPTTACQITSWMEFVEFPRQA